VVIAVKHTCSGNLGIVKILRSLRSATKSKLLYITQSLNPPNTVLHRSNDEIVKLDKQRTDNIPWEGEGGKDKNLK
jgi:hypothetical protein